MEYLDNFYNVVIKFLIDLNLKNVSSYIGLGTRRIFFNTNGTKSQNLLIRNNINILEKNLKNFDKSINLTITNKSLNVTNLWVNYLSDKNFNNREKNEIELYIYTETSSPYYTVKEVLDVKGELLEFYPFNLIFTFERFDEENDPIYDIIHKFQKYQRQVIKSLNNNQLNFYIKLRDRIKNKKILDQIDNIIRDSNGFIFYEGRDGKVKTLIFNER